MPAIRDFVGNKVGPYDESAELDKVTAFCRATGAPDPKVGDPVPLTYSTSFRKREFELFYQLGIPLDAVLHAEQEYIFKAPIYVGQKLSCLASFTNTREKRGRNGGLLFLDFETRVQDRETGELLVIGTTTLVQRLP